MLCGRPGPTALPTESVDCRGPGMLPESSGLPANAITSLQDWQLGIHKSKVLPHNLTFEETGGEEPGTVQDTVIGTLGMHSITVCLPQQFQGVCPVFYASQLKPAFLNPFPHREQPPPLPIELDGEMEYEVSEILNSKLDCHFKTGYVLCYLIHWVEYEGMDKETSWVAASNLANSLDLCASFHQHYPHKPGPHTKC